MSRTSLLAGFLSLVASNSWAWINLPSQNDQLCTASNFQIGVAAVPDGSGGTFFAWQDKRTDSFGDIYAQHLQADGTPFWTPGGIPVCSAVNDQRNAQLCADGAGGVLIVWEDNRSPQQSARDIFAQRLNAQGQPLWTLDGRPICRAYDQQLDPVICTDQAGGALIAWNDRREGEYQNDIYAQRVDASGNLLWPDSAQPVCVVNLEQVDPLIVSDNSGGAYVSWRDKRLTIAGSGNIYAQRLLPTGEAAWTTEGLHLAPDMPYHYGHDMVADGNNGAIVCWHMAAGDLRGVRAQRINAVGDRLWSDEGSIITTDAATQFARVTSDAAGGAVIAWQDYSNTLDSRRLFAQRINSAGQPQWANVFMGESPDPSSGDKPEFHSIVSDGASGATVIWQKSTTSDSDSIDLFAQRVDSAGQVLWQAGGVPVSNAPGQQISQAAVPDGAGGAVIAWYDRRGGQQSDLYASHLLGTGFLDGTSEVADIRGSLAVTTVDCKESGKGTRCKITGTLQLSNPGDAQTQSFNVRIYLSNDGTRGSDDFLLKQIRIKKLKGAANIVKNYKVKLPIDLDPHGKTLLAVLDSDDTVAEIDESNNTLSASVP